MKAAVFTAINRIEMQEVPTPTPKPDEVLIRVRATGVCGSEVHAFQGTHPVRKPPAIMGHELAGDVAEVGSRVRAFRPGDRVVVEPRISCGTCLYCGMGEFHLCANKVLMGTTAWPGPYADYVLAPESTTIGIPPEVSYEEGAMVEPLAVGVHSARKVRLGVGESALVLGAGPIGLCCIAAARAAGATRVVATDVFDFNLELARKVGATTVVNVRRDPDLLPRVVAEQVRPEGADVAFVTAGFASVMNQALALVRRAGRIAQVAIFDDALEISTPYLISNGEREIIGIHAYARRDFLAAVDLIANRTVDVLSMVTHRLPLEQALRALQLVADKSEDNAKVLLVNE